MSSRVFKICKGLDIPVSGAPSPEVVDALASPTVALNPAELPGVKPRLLVKEGDAVKRGTPLIEDKRNPKLRFVAPAAGIVARIEFGPRRIIERMVIERGASDEAESLAPVAAEAVAGLAREDILDRLLATGYLGLIRQRPFSGIADPASRPKSIFVNGMNSAPFLPDLHVAVRGHERAFQAGLDLLARLTDGRVHLCLKQGAAGASDAVTGARNAVVHYFEGPHPAGNTSVHIYHIDPIVPGDIVWTVKGIDVIQLGRLFLDGEVPPDRVIAFGGPGAAGDQCRHYRVREGASITTLTKDRLADGEQRIVVGDLLAGTKAAAAHFLPFGAAAVNIVPEGRDRRLFGWLAPGLDHYSQSRTFLSTWLHTAKTWTLTTNRGGAKRAMIVTGLYDRYLPMNIMVDYLARAVLAHDTEEAVKLGLLETDPEDFALCAFVCPSKTDLVGIIRAGLAEVEQEGI